MRRMYGDERHISVLRSEIESNDVDYQNEKWTHDSNFKHYKHRKEEYKSTPKTTTTSSTTTVTAQPTMTNRTTINSDIPNTTTSNPDSTETTESDYTTTEFEYDSTTEYVTTAKIEEQAKIQIFQDTLDKTTSTTTEEQLMYKTKGV